jgi:hypothetical protein
MAFEASFPAFYVPAGRGSSVNTMTAAFHTCSRGHNACTHRGLKATNEQYVQTHLATVPPAPTVTLPSRSPREYGYQERPYHCFRPPAPFFIISIPGVPGSSSITRLRRPGGSSFRSSAGVPVSTGKVP